MRRNKLWLLLVALVLIVPLTTCAPKPTPAPTRTPTPAPEVAPKPTPTPIPEEAPAPAPTPTREAAAKFQLLDYNIFIAPNGNLKIVGMIENTGDAASRLDTKALRLVDASGNVVAEPSPTTLELIAPGQKSPLKAEIYEHQGIPENWQELEVRLEEEGYPVDLIFEEYTPLEAENLASKAFETQAEGEPGIYGVSGWITNNAESPTERPTVLVAGYDAWGKLVDVVSTCPHPEYLNPGISAPFIATLSMVEPIVTYEVFAQGEVVEPSNLVELEIADYSIVGPDRRGETHFLGEVVNRGSALAVETRVVIALVTEQAEVVDIDFTIGSAVSLAPGDRLPCKLSSYAPQEWWDKPVFLVQGFMEDSLSDTYTGVYTDLKLEGRNTLGEKYGRYCLTGQISNTGESEAEVDVLAALYDAKGKVIDVAGHRLWSWDFGPGSSETLELTFSVEVEEEVASFKVFYGGLASRY